jgi:hypothetical protein
VGHDLDVGLRRELDPVGEELVLELHEVLHDPVDDDVDAVVLVEVRVGVVLAHAAVRGPARVADAGGGGRRGDGDAAAEVGLHGLVDRGAQGAQVADGAHRLQVAIRLDRDARRVIPAVLKLLKTGEEDLLHRALSDVADDAAHGPGLLSHIVSPTLDGPPF